MTVAELIERLKLLPPDTTVWVHGKYEQDWPIVRIATRGEKAITIAGQMERDWS